MAGWKVLLPCAATIAAVSAQSYSYDVDLFIPPTYSPTPSPSVTPQPTNLNFIGTLFVYDSGGDGWDGAQLAVSQEYFGVPVFLTTPSAGSYEELLLRSQAYSGVRAALSSYPSADTSHEFVTLEAEVPARNFTVRAASIELSTDICYTVALSGMVNAGEIGWEIVDEDGNRVLSAGLDDEDDGGGGPGPGGPGPGRRLLQADDFNQSNYTTPVPSPLPTVSKRPIPAPTPSPSKSFVTVTGLGDVESYTVSFGVQYRTFIFDQASAVCASAGRCASARRGAPSPARARGGAHDPYVTKESLHV